MIFCFPFRFSAYSQGRSCRLRFRKCKLTSFFLPWVVDQIPGNIPPKKIPETCRSGNESQISPPQGISEKMPDPLEDMATLRENPVTKAVKLLVGPTCKILRSNSKGLLRRSPDRCAKKRGALTVHSKVFFLGISSPHQ